MAKPESKQRRRVPTSSVTHFEIYAEEPAKLADFYRDLFGWEIEKTPEIDYSRI